MATKSMAYDHPAYVAVIPVSVAPLTGAAGTTGFAAFTAMLVKSITMHADTAGTTASDAITALFRPAAGTSTTTTVIGTFGSAVTNGTTFFNTFTMAQGDSLRLLKGADATTTYSVTFETVIVPGSTVTA